MSRCVYDLHQGGEKTVCGKPSTVHIHVDGRGHTGISLCDDHAIEMVSWQSGMVQHLSSEIIAARTRNEPAAEGRS